MEKQASIDTSSRLSYIDYLEVLAITFIVYCHYSVTAGTSPAANILLLFSFSFCVSIFFMANGTLLMNHPLNLKKHLKKILWLFIATAAWKAVYLLTYYLTQGHTLSPATTKDIFNYFLGYDLTDPEIPASHFWFMYELIGLYLIFPLIKIVHDSGHREILKYLMILLFLFVFVYSEYENIVLLLEDRYGIELFSLYPLKSSIFPLDKGSGFLLYFLLGPVLHDHFYVHRQDRSRFTPVLLFFLFFFFYALLVAEKTLTTGSIVGDWEKWGDMHFRLGAFGGTVCLYSFFAYCSRPIKGLDKIAAFVSIRTMNIYCIHMLLCYLFILLHYQIWPFISLGMHILKTFIIIILSLLITEIMTYIPGLSRLFGVKPDRFSKRKKG